MKSRKLFLAATTVWILALGAGIWLLAKKVPVKADLTYFLPSSNDTTYQLLIHQLEHGPGSQMILMGITGGEPRSLARANRTIADSLRRSGFFSAVNNGEVNLSEEDLKFFLRYRYLIGPQENDDQFSEMRLREGLNEKLKRLNSSYSFIEKRFLGRDPTGKLNRLARLFAGKGPVRKFGVWFSKDLKTTLLMARTKSSAYELASQTINVRFIQKEFDKMGMSDSLRLLMTGPSVFSVQARKNIRQELILFSSLVPVLIALFLWAFFRSYYVLLLVAPPLVSGIVLSAGIVAIIFQGIHGITLVFGVTLLGLGIDYPLHIITHAGSNKSSFSNLQRIGQTIAFSVLTTCTGYLAMLLTNIAGLAQLAAFAILGLAFIGLASRWAVPRFVQLIPAVHTSTFSGTCSRMIAPALQKMKWLPYLLFAGSVGFLGWNVGDLWNDNLANLSPINPSQVKLDQILRREMRVPQPQKLILVGGGSLEDVLQKSEKLIPALDQFVAQKRLQGYEMAALLLPSKKTQRARQERLPDPVSISRKLENALEGLPFSKDTFAPFLIDLRMSKSLPPLDLDSIENPLFRSALEPLVYPYKGRWLALVPLVGSRPMSRLQSHIQSLEEKDIHFIDLKHETEKLIQNYRDEVMKWIAVGVIIILSLLLFVFHNIPKVLKATFPVATAILATACLIRIAGNGLSIIHLISLLLVAGVGLDYGIFFQRHFSEIEEKRKTLHAILACNGTTLFGFSFLIFSQSQVLVFIGSTVSCGVFLSILFYAIVNRESLPTWGDGRPG